MKKVEIVKNNTDFDDIINNGEVIKAKYFNIYYKDDVCEYPKFGIAVSKKLGNAVVRNKLKRQIRMIIDTYKKEFQNNRNYIIILKKGILEVKFQEIVKDFEKTLERGI